MGTEYGTRTRDLSPKQTLYPAELIRDDHNRRVTYPMADYHWNRKGNMLGLSMDQSRYEPGLASDYGASGIAREGMEERYATALWRDDPSAFFLHPEGPLSDTGPKEYFVPRPDLHDMPNYLMNAYNDRGLLSSGAYLQAVVGCQTGLSQSRYNHGISNGIMGLPSGVFDRLLR
jgi:hypothetical protein